MTIVFVSHLPMELSPLYHDGMTDALDRRWKGI